MAQLPKDRPLVQKWIARPQARDRNELITARENAIRLFHSRLSRLDVLRIMPLPLIDAVWWQIRFRRSRSLRGIFMRVEAGGGWRTDTSCFVRKLVTDQHVYVKIMR